MVAQLQPLRGMRVRSRSSRVGPVLPGRGRHLPLRPGPGPPPRDPLGAAPVPHPLLAPSRPRRPEANSPRSRRRRAPESPLVGAPRTRRKLFPAPRPRTMSSRAGAGPRGRRVGTGWRAGAAGRRSRPATAARALFVSRAARRPLTADGPRGPGARPRRGGRGALTDAVPERPPRGSRHCPGAAADPPARPRSGPAALGPQPPAPPAPPAPAAARVGRPIRSAPPPARSVRTRARPAPTPPLPRPHPVPSNERGLEWAVLPNRVPGSAARPWRGANRRRLRQHTRPDPREPSAPSAAAGSDRVRSEWVWSGGAAERGSVGGLQDCTVI